MMSSDGSGDAVVKISEKNRKEFVCNGDTLEHGKPVNGRGDEGMDEPDEETLEVELPEFDQKLFESSFTANHGAHREGIQFDEMVDYYSNCATTTTDTDYENSLCPGQYNGPTYGAYAVQKYLEKEGMSRDSKILDVAAGTGLCGEQLSLLGYRNVDALEPAQGMVEKARKKGVYKNIIQDFISEHKPHSIKDCTYNALVTTGGMGEGHIPVEAIDQMIRIVKRGGLIIIVMYEKYLETVPAYKEKLEPYMAELVEAGRWKKVARILVERYAWRDEGVVFVYKVV